jgi:hypothetical protein
LWGVLGLAAIQDGQVLAVGQTAHWFPCLQQSKLAEVAIALLRRGSDSTDRGIAQDVDPQLRAIGFQSLVCSSMVGAVKVIWEAAVY